MGTSVPQIEETATRTRTSSGFREGIGTLRISVLLGSAFDFTAAFIVDVKQKPRAGVLKGCAYFNFVGTRRLPRLRLDRVDLRGPVPDEDEEVFLLTERAVEVRVARVHPEDGRRRELARGRDDDHVRNPDSAKDRRAHLEVASAEDESLGPDRAHDEFRLGMALEEVEETGLVQVLRDRLPVEDR